MASRKPPKTIHPAAEIFPMMHGEELKALATDIMDHGLQNPVTLTPDGLVLDGRNRLVACETAGVQPSFVTYDGDPWSFVITQNLHRRHLTDTQRAIIAARLAIRRPGRPPAKGSADTFEPPKQAVVAELLQINRTAVHRGRLLLQSGVPELVEVTESHHIPLATAARVAGLKPDQQRDFVTQVQAGTAARAVAPPEVRTPVGNVKAAKGPTTVDDTAEPVDQRELDKLVFALEGMGMSVSRMIGRPVKVKRDVLVDRAQSVRRVRATLARLTPYLESFIDDQSEGK